MDEFCCWTVSGTRNTVIFQESSSLTSIYPKGFDISVASGTRYSALLNSNEPPDESEFPFVRSVMAKTEVSLAGLDAEIANLRGIQRYSPRFEGYLQNCFVKYFRGRCLYSKALGKWATASDRAHGWLPRSAVVGERAQLGYSQTFRIHFYPSQEMNFRPQLEMLKLLLEHSSRWEELSLGLTAEMIPSLVGLRDRIPSLRRLWIQWSTVEDQTGVHSIDCFQTAPSLVDTSIFNEYRFVPVLLPVHQLTRYDIDCQLEGHIRVLKQTPNVIKARIDIAFDKEAWPDSLEIVDLLRLRRLYISSAGALKYFKVPALEELALGNSGEDTPSHFLSLLDRSSCSL
ncbi:hypothetical protein DFH08DRAFT_1044507 [Mycena albidolilacea]|uniref:Uncharacterized protein n=1 Tax=Mycena albidolilacea TaxID=1033008 RepID=A0AAD7ECW0_9AGAR|nr:hypothetical protein DFH08DRAFT_1044507 [Mycena albidolilacea]